MMTERPDLETEKRLNDIMGLSDFEVDSEETAKKYMELMDKKMDELISMQSAMARAEAERYEKQMSEQPRSVRRMFQKNKFADRFKTGSIPLKRK